jgi:hypothetical protein
MKDARSAGVVSEVIWLAVIIIIITELYNSLIKL